MARLWLHFEDNRVVRVVIVHDNRNMGLTVKLRIGRNWFQLGRLGFFRQGSGAASIPISEGSSADSGHDYSSASSNPISQMGERSNSDYDQQFPVSGSESPDYSPHDDAVHGSGSQSLTVEDHSGADDYQESSGSPLSGTSETSPDGANVSDILRIMTGSDLPPLVKPLGSAYYNLACLMNPVEKGVPEIGEPSGVAAGMNIDVQRTPQYSVPDTPETPFAALFVSDDREIPLDPSPAGTHPSSRESPNEYHYQEISAGSVSGSPETSCAMARIWVHFENNTWRLAILDNNYWRGRPRVHMQIRPNGFAVQRFSYVSSRAPRNPISEASSGDSGHEDSGASSKSISQMGEPSTSNYHQEIPHDDPVPGDSSASGYPSPPVELHSGADDYQGSPQYPFPDYTPETSLAATSISDDQESPVDPQPGGSHPSSSEYQKKSDQQESSAGPVSGTPEASPEGTNVSGILRCMTGSDLPARVKGLDEYYQLAGLINPGKNVSHSSSNVPASELSGEAEGMNIDEIRGKKTGGDGKNTVMTAEKEKHEGSSSVQANVLNAGDVPGSTDEATERDETKSSDD